jgi:hypothetical protein
VKPGLKGVLLALGGYAVTMAVALVASITAFAVVSPHGCASYGRALVAIWVALAGTLLLSVIAVGFAAGRLGLGAAARWGLVVGYGFALLVTFVVIGFGLLIGFNC